MKSLESVVRYYLSKLTRHSDPTTVDLTKSLVQELGLSSLDLVLLITNTCKEAAISMTHLTEQDLRSINTGQDLIHLLTF